MSDYDPIDKYFKSLIHNTDDDGTINIRLHAGDVSALLDILDFAKMASKYLKEAELRRGGQEGVRKMMHIERDSRELLEILSAHLDIGEPESDQHN